MFRVKAYPVRNLTAEEKQVCEFMIKNKKPKMETVDGRVAMLQNPKKKSFWSFLVTHGHNVIQFVKAPAEWPLRYDGVVVDDMYIRYKKEDIVADRAQKIIAGFWEFEQYYKDGRLIAIGEPRKITQPMFNK